MRISILCTDKNHPINPYLARWMDKWNKLCTVELFRQKNKLIGGDILFLVSCSEIVTAADRSMYGSTLVLHASDLPLGRGWSPHVWQIINGARSIKITLLEAEDKVDSGRIWKKMTISIPDYILWNEINDILFNSELELMDYAVTQFGNIEPTEQDSYICGSYYRKRVPGDSRLDPNKSIAAQFDKIRVCDPDRFPAFFELRDHRYKLTLERLGEQSDED